jgi:sensor histidine kinase YesM
VRKHHQEIIFNFIFWSLYFLYQWLGLAALSGDFSSYFINACMALPSAFIVSYLTVRVFLKRYSSKEERLTFWGIQITVTVLVLLLRRTINYYFIYPLYFPEAKALAFFSPGKWIIDLVNLYLIAGAYALFYFVRSWYEERQRVQALMQEKTLAELELLKSQVQPHFIFNALNNIYSTSLTTSPETARLIEHLSGFLNYNLYEAKQDFVPMASEINYLKHYIELQKNRFGNKLDAAVNIYEDISDLFIAPLLLLPLVENCFKHGVDRSMNRSWIRIDVSRQENIFSIKIENSVEEKAEDNDTTNGGIGIKNVQTRLALIYPHAHEFKIFQQPHSFLVVLKLNVQNDKMCSR